MDDSTKEASKRKNEPEVEMFGENIDSQKGKSCCDKFDFHNHRYHGSLTWGLILVLIGVMFLLSNFGVLPSVNWSQIVRLWPVIIILIGVDTLMGQSEVSGIINSLIGLLIFATILGIVFLNTTPQIINGLPQNIQNYLYSVNSYFMVK